MTLRNLITVLFLVACTLSPKLLIGQTTHSTPFSFTLADSVRTSAGVFAKDGTLIKTLWSGVSYPAGTYSRNWDGQDDEGRLVPDAAYDVRVLSNKVNYTWEGVIGNTSTVPSGDTYVRATENMASMVISGTSAYCAVHYNEQSTSCYKFNTGSPQAKTDILEKGAMVWLVATDGTRVYWGAADPNNFTKSFVFVTNTTNDAEATLANAQSVQTVYGRTYTSAITVVDNANSAITGLAVQKTGNYLFVSRQNMNTILVLNKTTGAQVASLSLDSPRQLAIDKNDNVWIISAQNKVAKYTVQSNGALVSTTTSLTGLVDPLALAVSPDGVTIMVADGGTNQQIKGFNTTSAAILWTFGQRGGYVTDPTVANNKFYFSDTRGSRNPLTPTATQFISTFIAFQSDGSFWVGDLGNNRAQHFTATRTFIDRIMYLPGSLNTHVDSNNPNRLFSDYLEFAVNYALPLNSTNGSWTLVKNWGATITPEYNGVYSGRLRFVTTLSNRRTYATLSINNTYELVELPANGPIRLTGIRFPNVNYQLYPDGSLRVVSTAELGLPVTWQKRALTGFDGSNNPQWAALQSVASSPPITPVDPVYWGNVTTLTSGETTSSNVVVSFDAGKPAFGHSTGYHLGGIRAGSSKWLWRTAPSTNIQYTGDYPSDGAFDIGNGVEYAGSRALVVDRSIFWGYHGEFWKQRQTNKWHHVYDNGLQIGQFGVTGIDDEQHKVFAGMGGNTFSCSVVKAPNDPGTAYLYHNDDGVHSGVHRWKISGLNTIQEQIIPVVLTSTRRGLSGDYIDKRELSNANLKTTRIDSTLNFSWPAGALGTALPSPTVFSARWQGFVQPRFSETYTFYTDTDGPLRLWVDGKLVIDKWTNTGLIQFSSDVIALETGKRYAIRLEYASGSQANRIGLWWSSARQSKQIIPTAQLIPAEPVDVTQGVDLLAYLSPAPGRPLEDKLYGWSRSPAQDDYTDASQKWWSVRTGLKSYGRLNASDLSVKFAQSSGTYTVTRDLGTNTGLQSWRLSGKLSFEDESGNRNEGGVGYFEVLDNQSNVLIRLFVSDTYPIFTVYANNKIIAQLQTGAELQRGIYRAQPLIVQMVNGVATVRYGAFPAVTVTAVDSAANWQSPRTMRLYFQGNADNRGHAIGVESMRFLVGPNATRKSDLSLTLQTDKLAVQLNEVVSFYLKIKNTSGPDSGTLAQASWVCRLPPNLEMVDSHGLNYANNTLSGTVTNLATLSDTVFVFKARPQLAGTYRTTAQLKITSLSDPDSVPDSGTADGQDDQAQTDFRTKVAGDQLFSSPNPSQTPLPLVKIQQVGSSSTSSDLSLNMILSTRTPALNDVVSCTLSVSNRGGARATTIKLQDQLPAGLQFVDGANWEVAGNTLTYTLSELLPGATASVLFRARTITSGYWINQAQIQSASPADPDSTAGNGCTNGEDDEAQTDFRVR